MSQYFCEEKEDKHGRKCPNGGGTKIERRQYEKELERLEMKNAELERRLKYETKGKGTKSLDEMERIFESIRQQRCDRNQTRTYLLEHLSDERTGRLDKYRLREMLNYINKKVFKVYRSVGEQQQGHEYQRRRTKLLLKLDEDPEQVFTLTLTDPMTKKR